MKSSLDAVVAVVVISLMCLPASGNPIMPSPWPIGPPPLYPETALYINGDDDFSAESDMVSGSGTLDDPYRIEDLVFSGTPDVVIIVEYTTKPLILRNLSIEPRSYDPDDVNIGIQLWHCDNVIIRDCAIGGALTGIGIGISHSHNVTVKDCTITNDDDTNIGVGHSSEITIVGNTLAYSVYGIWLESTTDSEVGDNSILKVGGGIHLEDCERVTVLGNEVLESNTPYFDNQPSLNTWPESQDVVSSSTGQLLLLGVALPACAAMLAGTALLRWVRRRHVAEG